MDEAGPLLLALYGRELRLVCARTGQHFQGCAAAAGWLAKQGCRGKAFKALKGMRQLDVAAAWVRHATEPKCDEFAADVGRMLDLAGFAPASNRLRVRDLVKEVKLFDIFDEDGNKATSSDEDGTRQCDAHGREYDGTGCEENGTRPCDATGGDDDHEALQQTKEMESKNNNSSTKDEPEIAVIFLLLCL